MSNKEHGRHHGPAAGFPAAAEGSGRRLPPARTHEVQAHHPRDRRGRSDRPVTCSTATRPATRSRCPPCPTTGSSCCSRSLILIPVMLMVALPLINGRSPHITVYPEQVEVGLTEIKGLDTQVDEVVRSLDVFLGYATFRDELGGTPRRGILFEGPPGTGKTYLAKAMAKQAGVPFLFISAPAFQSMWQGMTAYRIRSFFKALRKAARKEGGAIGFIEEIDAIGMSRGGNVSDNASPDDAGRGRSSNFGMGDTGLHGQRAADPDAVVRPAAHAHQAARQADRLDQRLPAQRPAADADQVRVPQHPADRGHQPRRLARPRPGAPGPLRPASVLRRAHQAGPCRADRLLPRSQAPSPAAGRRADPRAHRVRDVRLHARS